LKLFLTAFSLVLAACATSGGRDSTTDLGGDDTGPGSGAADYCAESARSTVDDPAAPASGFDFAANDAIAASEGAWHGSFTRVDKSAEGLALDLNTVPDTSIQAIYQELITHRGGEGGPLSEGAPSADCPPFYESSATMSFNLEGGALAERFDIVLRSSTIASQRFTASEDLSVVAGTERPVWFDPSDWAQTRLLVDASFDGTTWQGSAMWQASSEASVLASAAVLAGHGGSETGWVEPSGVSEGIGGFSVARAEAP
jgi:hypothetical protein